MKQNYCSCNGIFCDGLETKPCYFVDVMFEVMDVHKFQNKFGSVFLRLTLWPRGSNNAENVKMDFY